MSENFEEYLRDMFAKNRNVAEIEKLRLLYDRTRNFDKKAKEELERRIKDLEEKEKDEVDRIQRKTDEKLKEIEKKRKTEEENYEKLAKEIRANGEKELEEKTKVYDGMISKNIDILKVEQLRVENDLLKTEKDLKEISGKIKDTIDDEQEKTCARREKLFNEQKERDEEKVQKIMEKQNEKLEIEIKTSAEVAGKSDKLHNEQNQLIAELENNNLKTQVGLFETLQISNHQYNNQVMNEFVTKLQMISDDIRKSYGQCNRYLVPEFKWDEQRKKRARDSFEDLSALFNKSARKLTEAERRLADLENDEISKIMAEKINEMREKLYSLNTCTSIFCGLLLAELTNWADEDKKQLSNLMKEFSEIKFPQFNSKNGNLESHLKESIPKVAQPVEQKRIQQ